MFLLIWLVLSAALLQEAFASPFGFNFGPGFGREFGPFRRPPSPFIPVLSSSSRTTTSRSTSVSSTSSSFYTVPPRSSSSSSSHSAAISSSSSSSSAPVVVGTVAPSMLVSSSVSSSSSSSTMSSSSTVSAAPTPTVTDLAYIDTVLRHHNVHRLNHSAPLLTWSSSLADTARQIASSCVFAHNVTAGGGGYGQNIGAGYMPTSMGQFISEGLYNSEMPFYTYYGMEPNMTTFGSWGHFSQVVWKSTTAVGCYTYNCTATGLGGVPAGVPPFFSVCNYSPPGNFIGQFNANIGSPLGQPSVFRNYECSSAANCVGPTQ